MMQKQKIAHDKLVQAGENLRGFWKEHYGKFPVSGVPKALFRDVEDLLGAVTNNLINFTKLSFVPKEAESLPPLELQALNESNWQKHQSNPNYHQRLRPFFPNGRIPTSMDMTRLGWAFLAEANLLRITDLPVVLDRKLGPTEDPVAVASAIVNTPPPPGHSKAWAKRLKPHLDFRPESELRSDPNFAVFVAAVRNFLDNFEENLS